MPHFDLHCHSTGKVTMMEEDITLCNDPFQHLDFTIDPFKLGDLAGVIGTIITDVAGRQALERLFGDPLDSQCNFDRIEGGSLITLVLISIERAYTEIRLFEAITELNKPLFDKIRKRDTLKTTSYHTSLIDRELAYINRHNGKLVNGRRFQIINSMTEYPAQPDPNTFYAMVSVEGGHNFYTFPDQKEQEKPENLHTAVEALTQWKQSANRPRLLYTTVTHHAQNALSNHPWAIPASFSKVVEQNLLAGSFTPTGNGLTQAGFNFIDAALRQTATEKRVLIDIKHLSTVARSQAYAHIRQRFPGTPLIASHAGVTGMSWKDQPSRVDSMDEDFNFPKSLFASFDQLAIRGFMYTGNGGRLTSLTFNGWSVNLFDEDIIEIMASGGLIGIQLDPRILGAKGTGVERFSKAEYRQRWHTLPVVKMAVGDVKDAYTFDPLSGDLFSNFTNESSLHRWHFCQTIIHIILVITREKQAGNPRVQTIDPWDHICLGSDYDGLITAIKTAPKADNLGDLLNQKTRDCLQAMAMFLNARNANFGGHPIITPFDVLAKLRQTNGVNFLRTHFS